VEEAEMKGRRGRRGVKGRMSKSSRSPTLTRKCKEGGREVGYCNRKTKLGRTIKGKRMLNITSPRIQSQKKKRQPVNKGGNKEPKTPKRLRLKTHITQDHVEVESINKHRDECDGHRAVAWIHTAKQQGSRGRVEEEKGDWSFDGEPC